MKQLKSTSHEHSKLPAARSSDVEKQNLFKTRLNKVIRHFDHLVHGNYEDFTNDKQMNLRARIDEKFEKHYKELVKPQEQFLTT